MIVTIVPVEGGPRTEDVNLEVITDFQSLVGGYVAAVEVIKDYVYALVDEDGLPKQLPMNAFMSAFLERVIVGPAVIVGSDGSKFIDVPEELRVDGTETVQSG